MYCHNCGREVLADASFCSGCGTKAESPPLDLVEQRATVLDLSNDIAVNNDALVEKSAKWHGSPIPQVTPLVKIESRKPSSPVRIKFSYRFASDAYIFPSLEEELKKNLLLQRDGAEEVYTDVEWQEDDGISFQFVASFMINGRENVGISSCVFVKPDSRQERRFQRLDIFKLFEKEDGGDDDTFDVYFIDFEDNCKDAARFFTVIAEEIFGYKKTDVIEFNTTSDIDPIIIEEIFKTDISGVVMQYGTVEGVSKYWFAHADKRRSDYYEFISKEGVFQGAAKMYIAQKNNMYGFVKIDDSMFIEEVDPYFVFDLIYWAGCSATTYEFEEFQGTQCLDKDSFAYVNYKGKRHLLLLNDMSLYEIPAVPPRRNGIGRSFILMIGVFVMLMIGFYSIIYFFRIYFSSTWFMIAFSIIVSILIGIRHAKSVVEPAKPKREILRKVDY